MVTNRTHLVVSQCSFFNFDEHAIYSLHQGSSSDAGNQYLGLDSCDFIGCGKNEAAVAVTCRCTIVKCTFHLCGSEDKGDGKALQMTIYFNSTVANTNFTSCWSSLGAGLSAYVYASLTITHCYFASCTSYSVPASLYVALTTPDADARARRNSNVGCVTLTSSAFSNNTADTPSTMGGVDAAIVVNPDATDAASLVKIEKCYTDQTEGSNSIVAVTVADDEEDPTPIASAAVDVHTVTDTSDDAVAKAAGVSEDAGVTVESEEDDKGGISTGAIVGIVVAVLVVVIVIVAVILLILLCKRRSSSDAGGEEQSTASDNTAMEAVPSADTQPREYRIK